jgi:hypothetical protein
MSLYTPDFVNGLAGSIKETFYECKEKFLRERIEALIRALDEGGEVGEKLGQAGRFAGA